VDRAEPLAAALEQDADQIHHHLGAAGGGLDRFGVAQVRLNGVDLADAAERLQVPGEVGPAHRHADAVAALAQGADEMAADKARAAENGHEPVHVGLSKHADFCRLAKGPLASIQDRRRAVKGRCAAGFDKGGRGQTNYAASKGAINALTRALAAELAPRKITVNAVAPGVIETDMSQAVRDLAGDEVKSRILLRRFGSPREVAFAVWFLASSLADYITGQVLCVDGGFKME